jgi:hypothetical protein
MYRKSLSSGLLIGLLLTLTMSFVVINDMDPQAVPGQHLLEITWLPRDLLRTLSLYISALFVLFVGTLAALRGRPRRPWDGFKVGGLSGLAAAIVVYAFLLSPLAALQQAIPLYRDVLRSAVPIADGNLPPLLSPYITATWRASAGLALALPVVGMLVGALEGLVVTLLRRMLAGKAPAEEPAARPLEQVRSGARLLAADPAERALRAGLLGGLITGGFLSLEISFFAIQAALADNQDILNPGVYFASGHGRMLLALAGPLALLVPPAMLLRSGIGVLLLKNPSTRVHSRLTAAFFAAAVSSVIIVMVVALPLVNVLLLITPMMSEPLPLASERLLELSRQVLYGYPLIVLALVLGLTATSFFVGLFFVFLSAYLWPRRPVDRAASLARRLRREPDTLLPNLYALFQNDPQADDVLYHLVGYCQRRRGRPASVAAAAPDPHRARHLHRKQGEPPLTAVVAAAYYTLCSDPDHAADALKTTVDSLAQAPTWRWRGEISDLHRFLGEGWQARNLYHLAAIQPLAEEHTSSLPPALSKSWDHLSNIIVEIKKAQRLDDPNGRTIYLNRAQEEISTAASFVAEQSAPCKGRRKRCVTTPYPEYQVLTALLTRWQAILLESLRDLRGRAVLRVELLTRQTTYLPHLSLRFRVANEGLNVAERVCITLEPSPDYQLSAASEARIEMLPPGEEREVELALEPRNPRPMRVLLHILYNDAVDENRELTMADEVVFAAAERPFQRIFPIPYVTGTPLKSGEMFFGRQDVFAYIREHLLGVYQNNIIVLHGQRRTGKTSVLYRLPEVLGDTHYCVLLDMQGIAARSEAELFYTLSDEIAYALDKAGLSVTVPPREEYDAQPEFTFRSRFLRGIYPALGAKHLLLLFDEFEELQRHVEDGHIGTGIFPFLRTIMQHEQPVDFIFSGTHKLEDLAAAYWSILFNIATYKQISFLERGEAERLITEPVAPFGMEYDPLAVRQVYGVTAGHPFLTQLVCHELVAYHNETERSYITVADVDAVLERIAERGEAHFKYVWAGADGAERLTMLALSELLVHADAATAAEIAALTQNRRQSLDADTALRALVRLESRDIVARTAPGSERFRFRVDLVRRWVARNPQLIDTVVLSETA